MEISWSGVRFFFWKDKGSRGEKDTSYRMVSKSVYLPSPCDVARSRCCGGNVEISWSGVRFFFWKDKGSRGEKDTSYRMASKSVYLPSPCDAASSRRYRS